MMYDIFVYPEGFARVYEYEEGYLGGFMEQFPTLADAQMWVLLHGELAKVYVHEVSHAQGGS